MKLKVNIKKIILKYAPGIISGAADNDPSGITTYSLSGARFGYNQNFLMILATPMLISVQAMAGRIGGVKGKGLTLVLREFLPKSLVAFILLGLVVANVFTLGADVAAMGAAVNLIFPFNSIFWSVILCLIAWYLVLFKSFKDLQKYFLWLVLFFLSYIPAAVLSKPDWGEVLRVTILPQINFSSEFFVSALAVMGTTITPYLFFWQAKEEVEFHHGKKFSLTFAKTEERNLAPGMVFSQIITLFILTACGAVFFKNGVGDFSSAIDAAKALEPFAGVYAKYLFAVGIVGSGLLAIPVLSATTAYALSDFFGWRDSLWDKVGKAKKFYALITASIFVGLLVAVLPVNALNLLFYSQVLSGAIAPFLILALLYICNNRKIMGRAVNGVWDNFWGAAAALVMIGSLIFLVTNYLYHL